MTNVFGEFIKARREAQELKQTEVAEMVGISHSNLSYIESGLRSLPVEKLPLLATALKLDSTDTDYMYASLGIIPPDLGSIEFWAALFNIYRRGNYVTSSVKLSLIRNANAKINSQLKPLIKQIKTAYELVKDIE